MELTLSCGENNDLYRLLDQAGVAVSRVETPAEAIGQADDGAAVMILADGYPETPTPLDNAIFDEAKRKGLRLYVEYPAALPGLEVGEPRATHWERAAIASDRFAPALAPMRIVAIHDCHYVPVNAEKPDMVVARIAGFDTAVYGLPDDAAPILFEHPDGNMLVATTKLSQFVTARYAPSDAWQAIWRGILQWLAPDADVPALSWTPTVRPSFGAEEALPADVEQQALRRGAQWFLNAHLLYNPDWPEQGDSFDAGDRIGPPPSWPIGDGSHGSFEGFSSTIRHDGSQLLRWWMRNDCMGETAMALAFDGVMNDDAQSRTAAANLGDFVFFTSETTQGPRDDPNSDSFGLMSWDINKSHGVFYGDDNARSLLGLLACAALLDVDRWEEKTLRCFLANLRTTGKLGFRGDRLDQDPLCEHGWRHYFDAETTNFAPHYEAYLWACFLWAYRETGYSLFLERTKTAIRMTMDAYPDEWRWTNGLQQERARMLLPLAWLVQLEDTPEHRAWLRRIADDLLAHQDACGAIREELGKVGHGRYAPPKSNEEYGTREAPLIQENGDPLCDLLYTTNFAFLGLHEAAAATGEDVYADAADRLAKFLCRIQIRSEAHPELDGGWFRAFDFRRWEYWASNADLGWGAWSIESGWTCGWIDAVLAMRRMDTSFWALTADSTASRHLDKLVGLLLPDGE